MGRLGGRKHSLVSPTPAWGSEALSWIQRSRASLAHRFLGKVSISPVPSTDNQQTGQELRAIFLNPLLVGPHGF